MKLIVIFLSISLVFTACGPSPEQRAVMTATALTATAAAWTPTSTATNTPTITPSPTITETPLPTNTATATLPPTQTQDPARYYAPDNSFSIQIPKGWQTADLDLEFPGLKGPKGVYGNPNIAFIPDTSPFPMAMYSAFVQDEVLKKVNISSISEEFLTTPSGVEYFRWITENDKLGTKYQQIYYFFENGDWKLTILYTRQADEAPEQDVVVEQILNSIQFGP